jgi:hypothetical protein
LARAGWDAPVIVNSKAVDEIIFWKENTAILNGRDLSIIEQYSSIVYSDASGTGYGSYVVNIIDNEVMGRWNSVEGIQSSTWRELEAVYRVLLSLLDILQGQKNIFIYFPIITICTLTDFVSFDIFFSRYPLW